MILPRTPVISPGGTSFKFMGFSVSGKRVICSACRSAAAGSSFIKLNAVIDFPEPDSPAMPMTSPFLMVKEMLCTAVAFPIAEGNLTERFCIFKRSMVLRLFFPASAYRVGRYHAGGICRLFIMYTRHLRAGLKCFVPSALLGGGFTRRRCIVTVTFKSS